MVDVIQFALAGTGGVLGAWSRHLLGERIETSLADTLAVNVLGSFLLGLLLALPETDPLFVLAGVGFCGAFTTFSTFAFETVRLFETGDRRQAVLNAVGNLVAALVAVVVGIGVAGVVF
jgi:CrcB protein